MRRILALIVFLALATAVYSQSSALLSAKDASALFSRTLQLIESTSAAVPGLSRAGAPVLENARQALLNLESGPAGSAPLIYELLLNVRAYLALADSVPKPYPFPEEGRKQFTELRDSVYRMESHFQATLQQNERRLRNPDRDNLRRYAEANEKLAKPVAGQTRIVFLGDSITDGWRLNEYFPGRDFVNRGISGQITGEMLGRMRADVIDLKPSGVLVLAGTNDIARGVPLSAIENNLTMIADLAELYKIKPLLASVLPISDYHKDANPRYEMSKQRPPATIIELNRWIQGFCKQRHYEYVDYFAQTVDPAGYIKSELADDGLHPNSAGYRAMGPVALAAIDRAFAPQPVPVSRKRAPKTRASKPGAESAQAPQIPASATPAPISAVTAAPSPEPAGSSPQATGEAKPASKPEPAASQTADTAPPTKKKRDSFWKRTYPSAQPKQ